MIRRLIRRWARGRDDGSLPLAMMLTLVGTSLSTLMVPIVITQVRDTAETVERAKAVHAAQAGIDVVMGSIRASAGSIANLLCLPATDPLLGVTGLGADNKPLGRYQASVQFQDATNVNLPCPTRTSHLLSVPAFAVITSEGTVKGAVGAPFERAASRVLTATYVFRFTNENVEGGLVKFYGDTYCLDAGSGSPAVGTSVTTQPCSAGSPRQTFAYTGNLALQLVSSKTKGNPQGMCLDSGTDTPVAGMLVLFQVCGSPTVPWNQRWSLNDSSNFQSTDPSGTKLGGFCLHAKSGGTPGAFVEITTCGGAADNTRTFSPDAAVGAGAAGPPLQLVNFGQFGRCADVTNFDITKGFIIVWPCKQAPNQLSVGWNQRFTIPGMGATTGTFEGQILTYDSTKTKGNVCLTTAEPGAASHFVTMTPCPVVLNKKTDPTWWAVSYQDPKLGYPASYVIKDHNGKCLSPTDLSNPKLPSTEVFQGVTTASKLIVADCDASKLQKWNAPPNTADPTPLKNIGEQTPP